MAHLSPKTDNVVTDFGDTPAAPTRHRAIHGVSFTKVALLLFIVLVCLVSAEVTARVYWRVCCGVSLLKPDEILHAFYPELRASGELPEVLRQLPRRGQPIQMNFTTSCCLADRCSTRLGFSGDGTARTISLPRPAQRTHL